MRDRTVAEALALRIVRGMATTWADSRIRDYYGGNARRYMLDVANRIESNDLVRNSLAATVDELAAEGGN